MVHYSEKDKKNIYIHGRKYQTCYKRPASAYFASLEHVVPHGRSSKIDVKVGIAPFYAHETIPTVEMEGKKHTQTTLTEVKDSNWHR